MSLPGINYAKKPYCDVGDELPNVGDRVVYLPFTKAHIEGVVTAIDVPSRRVQISGYDGVWLHWKDFDLA